MSSKWVPTKFSANVLNLEIYKNDLDDFRKWFSPSSLYSCRHHITAQPFNIINLLRFTSDVNVCELLLNSIIHTSFKLMSLIWLPFCHRWGVQDKKNDINCTYIFGSCKFACKFVNHPNHLGIGYKIEERTLNSTGNHC